MKLQMSAARQEIIKNSAQEWLTHGLSCEPADFEAGETAITRLYTWAKLSVPKFIRLPSPAAAEAHIRTITGENKHMGTWNCGSMDAYIWGFFDTARKLGVSLSQEQNEALDNHCSIVRSLGLVYMFVDFCIITDRPCIINRDENNNLHCETGPALAYRDGYALYAIHGVRVSQLIVERPHEITIKMIDDQTNVEVRRVMIERRGMEWYVRNSGAKIIDHDERYGTLYRRNVNNDEPIVVIEVINRSPETDGSFRHYMLRVPPTMETAHEAVAWTFGKSKRDYSPDIET